jgi:hypothetical protein
MERVAAKLFLFVTVLFLTFGRVDAQDKPLAPGWLALEGSVGVLDNSIAEGKASLEKSLGINISGFVDTSYNWSSNHPKLPRNISGRYFDKDYNKLSFNDLNITLEKPEKDWGVGFKLVGDFGRTAELLREATLWGRTLHREPSAELREAFLTTTIPMGAGLQIKGGLFVTTLGAEIIPAPGAYNDNISRSFLFNFAIPFRHLGVLFTYPVHKVLSIYAGPVTGWDNPRDNNNQPSVLGGINFTPLDAFSLASNAIYGPEQRHRTGPKRFTWSNVATIKPFDPLTLVAEYTFGFEEDASLGGTRDARWRGLAGYASYAWTDRFTTAVRAEGFNDRDGARLGGEPFGTHAQVKVAEVTLTGAYKFTKMFLGRAEVRQDWANRRFYQRGSSNADKNQTTFALQLLYTY